MSGSPDFNLVGEISLQLAKGAAKKLRDEIQNGFTAPLAVDTKTAEEKVKRVKKKAASDPIVVPIIFDTKGITKKVQDAVGTVKVNVELNSKSVRGNLTNKKLLEILGEKKLTVPVEVRFGPKTEAQLNKVRGQIEKLLKKEEKLKSLIEQAASSGGGGGAIDLPELAAPTEIKDQVSDVELLVKKLAALAKVSAKVSKNTNLARPFDGSFFEFSDKAIKNTIEQLDKLGQGRGIDILKHKFEGLDGQAKKNLVGSLRILYRAYNNLDLQQERLYSSQKFSKNPNDKFFQSQIDLIEQTKKELSDYFLRLDSSDVASFGSIVDRSMSSAKDSTNRYISTLTRDAKDFDKLMNSLLQKQQTISFSGASQDQIQYMDDLIKRVRELGAANTSVLDIKKDSTVQMLNGVISALRNADILADRASSSVDALLRKTSKGELKNTFGGQLVDLSGQASSIGQNASKKIAIARAKAGNGNKEINDIQKEAAEDYAVAAQRAERLNRLYERIQNTVSQFNSGGFTKLATDTAALIPELERLHKAGLLIQDIDQQINSSLNNLVNAKGLENKVGTAIRQIERLRAAINLGGTEDRAGAIKMLDDLENNIQKLSGSGLNVNSLDKTLSEGVFNVRGANRFNEAVENTIFKLRSLGDANDNLQVGTIYEKYINQFEAGAVKIAQSTDNIGNKLKALKVLTQQTFLSAKIEADGGFFGSFAKAAGLATKRLAAFLFLAQGLYGVQSLFSTAISDSIAIDKEFTKLEQVLNKDFTGGALSKSLKSIESQILSLGKNFGVATVEVANAAQILAQAGIQGEKLKTILDTVAKSQLGPSFASATETAEAAIAIMNQFNLTAEETKAALGGINKVSAQYAVEAKGITEAVRRAGGVFSTGGDKIESFAASFTLIKQSTREADESIATALRNVAQRLQSSRVQDYIKKTLNVDLVDEGKFIGFEKAIIRIGEAIRAAGISEQSPLFSQIREQIAGRLQAGRITPLLKDFQQYEKLVGDFRSGANSIEEDVGVAFDSVENKVLRAKGAVVELFTEIINNKAVKILIEGFTQLTNLVTVLLRALNSLPGFVLAGALAIKNLGNIKFATGQAISQILQRTQILGRNEGGRIPGYGPNKDSMIIKATPGEYVIPRDIVNKYGVSYFDDLIGRNKGGVIPGYNSGGSIGGPEFPSSKYKHIDFYSMMLAMKFKNRPAKKPNKFAGMFSTAFEGGTRQYGPPAPPSQFAGMFLPRGKSGRQQGPPAPTSRRYSDMFASAANPSGLRVQYGPAEPNYDPNPKKTKGLIGRGRKKLGTAIDDALGPSNVPKVTPRLTRDSLNASLAAGASATSLPGASQVITSKGIPEVKAFTSNLVKSEKALSAFSGVFKLIEKNMLKFSVGLLAIGTILNATSDNTSGVGAIAAGAGSAALGGYAASQLGAPITSYFKDKRLKRAATGSGGTRSTLAKEIQARVKSGEMTVAEALRNRSVQKIVATKRAAGLALGSGAAGAAEGSIGFLSKSAGSLGKLMGKLGARLHVVGTVVGLLIGGLSAFAGQVADGADSSVRNADTLEQAKSSASTGRLGKMLEGPLEKLGSLFVNVISGISLGSAGGIPGMIAGAIGGVLFTFADQVASGLKAVLPTSWVDGIGNAVNYVTAATRTYFSKLSDGAYAMVNGTEALAAEYGDVENQFKLGKLSRKITDNKNKGLDTQLTLGNIGDLIKQTKVAGGIITQGGGNFQELADAPAEQVRNSLGQVAEIFNQLSTEEQRTLVDAFQRTGTDFQGLMNKVGVQINYTEKAAELAFDEMTNFFEGIKNTVARSAARATGLEAGLELFSQGKNPKDQVLASDKIFDVLGSGFSLAEVGLEAFAGSLDSSLRNIRDFDQGLYDAAKLQTDGASAARKAKQVVAASGRVRLKDGNTDTVQKYIQEVFDASGGAEDQALSDAFNKFLESKLDKLDDLTKDGGSINASGLNDLFTEFADSIDKGALEQAKRINAITQQWADNMAASYDKQLEINSKITDLRLQGLDKEKTLNELKNKASGKSDSELTNTLRNQAINLDNKKLREINFGNPAAQALVNNPQALIKQAVEQVNKANDIIARGGVGDNLQARAASVAEAKRLKKQGEETLGYIANGTESNTFALQNFEKAAERAAAATAKLSNALLGSDQQMLESVKGVVAFQEVQKAYAAGGTKAAQAKLLQFNEDARQALQGRVSGDASVESQLNKMLGINADLTNSPEYKEAVKKTKEQQNATSGQINVAQGDLVREQQNFEEMNKFFTSQFNRAQEIVQKAESTTKEIVDKLAAIPNLITHEGNIQVNIVGAGALEQLQAGMQDFIVAQVNQALFKYGDNLVKLNAGMKVPNQAQGEK